MLVCLRIQCLPIDLGDFTVVGKIATFGLYSDNLTQAKFYLQRLDYTLIIFFRQPELTQPELPEDYQSIIETLQIKFCLSQIIRV